MGQLRFAKAGLAQAERRGLRGLAALEWAEYLSWPECWRRAETGWRRKLLHRLAFEERVAYWQRALHARGPDDRVGTGPPRASAYIGVQLGPYPSDLEPWFRPTRQAPACLEAHIYFDPFGEPNPLWPVRRLDAVSSWTLLVEAADLYNGRFSGIQVLIDDPREYSAAEARAVLLAQATQLEHTLGLVSAATPPLPEEEIQKLARRVAAIREAALRIGQVGTAERAMILEHRFALPGVAWMAHVEILTDDLPPEWLGVLLGFAFERRGMLSVRDKKQLEKAAAAVLEHWQASRYPTREIGPEVAGRWVKRLAKVRRLLQPASLFAYLAKLARSTHALR